MVYVIEVTGTFTKQVTVETSDRKEAEKIAENLLDSELNLKPEEFEVSGITVQ